MHFTEYHTRLAAYALVVDDADQVLLSWYNGSLQRQQRPCWTLPGGGVEFDEAVEHAVRREVLEETGYQVDVHEPLAVHSLTFPTEPDRPLPVKSVRVVYRASITGGTLGTLEVGGTTERAQWMPIAQARLEPARAAIIDVALDAWDAR